jgi:hypothetical protein
MGHLVVQAHGNEEVVGVGTRLDGAGDTGERERVVGPHGAHGGPGLRPRAVIVAAHPGADRLSAAYGVEGAADHIRLLGLGQCPRRHAGREQGPRCDEPPLLLGHDGELGQAAS